MGVFKAARLTGTAGIAVLFAATIGLATPAHAAEGAILDANAADVVPNSYIVTLKGSHDAQALARKYGGAVKFVYKAALNGFAADMTATQARRLAADSAVEYVQADQVVSINATQANPPSWGLDRIDQRNRPLNSSYTYPNSGGAGVNAYIIDTGIRLTHSTFGGRARTGFDAITSGGTANDCNGHGTHVAGTVGGSQYGVAKSVTLYAVRVLSCSGSGTTAQVVAGVDWVTANRVRPAVANMSLGGGANTSIDAAVRRSIAAGVTYAIASGNSSGANACNYSPARVTEAITVNASTNTDARASFSNVGTCTDIFAPGQSIVSAWYTSNTATNNISGTSMAAPHVAGAAALVLAGSPSSTPAQVQSTLISRSTPNVITNAGSGSPNRLLFVNPT